MKSILLSVIFGGLVAAALSRAKDTAAVPSPDRVSFFKVPWKCPAAPEIGCGSLTKPILLKLERAPGISEAWLNRSGTVLAVVSAESSESASPADAIRALLEKKGAKATVLEGAAREQELKSFGMRDGWYRGAEVDKLSIEESGIIAARLVRRTEARVAVPADKAEALKTGFADALQKQFTRGAPKSERETLRNEELLKVARAHLDAAGVAAFQQAIAKGYRPEPNEK